MTGDYSRYKKIDIGRAKVGLFYIVQIVNIYDYETDIYKYEIYTHTYTYICVNMHIYISYPLLPRSTCSPRLLWVPQQKCLCSLSLEGCAFEVSLIKSRAEVPLWDFWSEAMKVIQLLPDFLLGCSLLNPGNPGHTRFSTTWKGIEAPSS